MKILYTSAEYLKLHRSFKLFFSLEERSLISKKDDVQCNIVSLILNLLSKQITCTSTTKLGAILTSSKTNPFLKTIQFLLSSSIFLIYYWEPSFYLHYYMWSKVRLRYHKKMGLLKSQKCPQLDWSLCICALSIR